MNRLKVGDTVVVISGSDKNRQGKIIKLLKKEGKALVKNVRVLKKCVKRNPNQNITGGIIPRESPIDLSNLMLYNFQNQKKEKVAVKTSADNKKSRYFRSSGEPVSEQARGQS